MRCIKLMAFAVLIFSAGFVSAAEAPDVPANPAPAAYKPVKITKVSGTVQLMKNGVVVMTIKPGDAIPANLDPGLSFHVVSGSIEVEAGGMKINGVTGSDFTPTFTNGSMVVASQGSGSVEVKSPSGYSVVLPRGSEVKMTDTGVTTNVEVQKGRAVVTDAAGGGTKIVNVGETAAVPSAPAVAAPAAAPVTEVVAVTGDAPVYNPADAAYVPATSVIATREAAESATVTEASEVSGSTP